MGSARLTRTFWKRALALAAGILLVVGLLLKVGLGKVAAALRGADGNLLLLALLSYAVFFILRGARWKLLLRPTAPGATVPTTAALSAFGWLVSTFVPMKAGDVARATLLSRRERAPLASVVGSVAVERMLDVVGLAFVASTALFGAAVLAHRHVEPIIGEILAIAWILPLLGAALLLVLAHMMRRRPSKNVVMVFARRFLDAVDELRRSPRRLPALLLLSVLVTAAQVAVFVCLFLAFDPSAFPPIVAAGVPLFLLSFAVPIVPGHIGTYEAAFILVFTSLGFDPDALTPMAFAIHLLTVSMVTFLGGIGFVVDRFTRAQESRQGQGTQVAP